MTLTLGTDSGHRLRSALAHPVGRSLTHSLTQSRNSRATKQERRREKKIAEKWKHNLLWVHAAGGSIIRIVGWYSSIGQSRLATFFKKLMCQSAARLRDSEFQSAYFVRVHEEDDFMGKFGGGETNHVLFYVKSAQSFCTYAVWSLLKSAAAAACRVGGRFPAFVPMHQQSPCSLLPAIFASRFRSVICSTIQMEKCSGSRITRSSFRWSILLLF